MTKDVSCHKGKCKYTDDNSEEMKEATGVHKGNIAKDIENDLLEEIKEE